MCSREGELIRGFIKDSYRKCHRIVKAVGGNTRRIKVKVSVKKEIRCLHHSSTWPWTLYSTCWRGWVRDSGWKVW